MKFFVPLAEDARIVKRATEQLRSSLKSRPAGPYRTRAITRSIIATGAKTYTLASGGPDPLNGEKVFAIFKPKNPISAFLVCGYSRGVVQDQPFRPAMMRRPLSLSQKVNSTERRSRRLAQNVNGSCRQNNRRHGDERDDR